MTPHSYASISRRAYALVRLVVILLSAGVLSEQDDPPPAIEPVTLSSLGSWVDSEIPGVSEAVGRALERLREAEDDKPLQTYGLKRASQQLLHELHKPEVYALFGENAHMRRSFEAALRAWPYEAASHAAKLRQPLRT